MKQLRLRIVFAVANLCRVPVKVRDEWWIGPLGCSDAGPQP